MEQFPIKPRTAPLEPSDLEKPKIAAFVYLALPEWAIEHFIKDKYFEVTIRHLPTYLVNNFMQFLIYHRLVDIPPSLLEFLVRRTEEDYYVADYLELVIFQNPSILDRGGNVYQALVRREHALAILCYRALKNSALDDIIGKMCWSNKMGSQNEVIKLLPPPLHEKVYYVDQNMDLVSNVNNRPAIPGIVPLECPSPQHTFNGNFYDYIMENIYPRIPRSILSKTRKYVTGYLPESFFPGGLSKETKIPTPSAKPVSVPIPKVRPITLSHTQKYTRQLGGPFPNIEALNLSPNNELGIEGESLSKKRRERQQYKMEEEPTFNEAKKELEEETTYEDLEVPIPSRPRIQPMETENAFVPLPKPMVGVRPPRASVFPQVRTNSGVPFRNNTVSNEIWETYERGDIAKLGKLIEKNFPLSNNGCKVLMDAIKKRDVEVIKMLINGGIDVNCNKFVLKEAIDTHDVDIVQDIVDAGWKVKDIDVQYAYEQEAPFSDIIGNILLSASATQRI